MHYQRNIISQHKSVHYQRVHHQQGIISDLFNEAREQHTTSTRWPISNSGSKHFNNSGREVLILDLIGLISQAVPAACKSMTKSRLVTKFERICFTVVPNFNSAFIKVQFILFCSSKKMCILCKKKISTQNRFRPYPIILKFAHPKSCLASGN